MPSSGPASSSLSDGDSNGSSYMSDRDFLLQQNHSHKADSSSESDEESTKCTPTKRPTGKHAYTSACTRLGIVPSSHVIDRLSSDRLSLRFVFLSPSSAKALSAGLLANRCIHSLNLGRNLLGDESARPLLEVLSSNGTLTRLDLSRNSLSSSFGVLLAESLSSPLCALRELVVVENMLSDPFTEALAESMNQRTRPSPLRSLDASDNKICDRNGNALASILAGCPSLVNLNLGWNDLRRAGSGFCLFAGAALIQPGRLVSLELSFNGLSDVAGVAIGDMMRGNACLSVLDLSRNHLEAPSAFSIANGLRGNEGLRALKLGWNAFGREGTLAVIRAIGENWGPLEMVRLENTTAAGMEFEASCEADSMVATRSRWIEVVCEYPDRARMTGNSRTGPVSWMTEHPPDRHQNTTYETPEERKYNREAKPSSPPIAASGDKLRTAGNTTDRVRPGTISATNLQWKPPPPPELDLRDGYTTNDERQSSALSWGPAKQAVAVPVLSVRLALRAIEEARLEVERLAAAALAAAEAEAARKKPFFASYLSPLKKAPRERTVTEPVPKQRRSDRAVSSPRRGGAVDSGKKGRTPPRSRKSTGRRSGGTRPPSASYGGRGSPWHYEGRGRSRARASASSGRRPKDRVLANCSSRARNSRARLAKPERRGGARRGRSGGGGTSTSRSPEAFGQARAFRRNVEYKRQAGERERPGSSHYGNNGGGHPSPPRRGGANTSSSPARDGFPGGCPCAVGSLIRRTPAEADARSHAPAILTTGYSPSKSKERTRVSLHPLSPVSKSSSRRIITPREKPLGQGSSGCERRPSPQRASKSTPASQDAGRCTTGAGHFLAELWADNAGRGKARDKNAA